MIKKFLVVMMALLMAASVAAVCNQSQNVNVKAPYLLNKIWGAGTVYITFGMNDYATGYVVYPNAIKLQVGAPGSWTLRASASGGAFGVVNALYAAAAGGVGWVDLDSIHRVLRSGSSGKYEFFVSYKVVAAELSTTSGQNINATVTVTYSFI